MDKVSAGGNQGRRWRGSPIYAPLSKPGGGLVLPLQKRKPAGRSPEARSPEFRSPKKKNWSGGSSFGVRQRCNRVQPSGHFRNKCSPFECMECGFSFRKKPLECEVSVYRNSENAIAVPVPALFRQSPVNCQLRYSVPHLVSFRPNLRAECGTAGFQLRAVCRGGSARLR